MRVILILVAMLAALMVVATPAAQADPPDDYDTAPFQLTVLHNNDGESQLVNAGSDLEDYGGAARFKALVDTQKAAATNVVMISSGDNFLAGPEFNLGLKHHTDTGEPIYDTTAMALIGYDAVNLGNHDFDFGPDVLSEFIKGYLTKPTIPAPGYTGMDWVVPPYVSANLDMSAEPNLAAQVDPAGPITTTVVPATPIAESTVVTVNGEKIGIIGLETPNLATISSPRNVVIDKAIVQVVKDQVAALSAAPFSVDKIILTSHLQDIDLEKALVADVTGLDVVIAGGGDELLANAGDTLIPGDEGDVVGAYPQWVEDKAGVYVPIVTTSGEYKYLGQLEVGFDGAGSVVGIGDASGPLMVSTAAGNDAAMQKYVVDPVVAGLAVLNADKVATSEVPLDGLRNSVRFMETNEGNLITDAYMWQAKELAADFGVDVPDVALTNGGGIRNNTIIPAGDLTVLDTFDMVPFPNFLSVVENVPIAHFKEILENAVSRVDGLTGGTGRFAQISGFTMMYNPDEQAQIVNDDGFVLTPGKRIQSVVLDDGTVLIKDGEVVPGKPTVDIATIDFLARGGDAYPYRGAPFTTLGVTYQQALENYLREIKTVTASDYPTGGEGRIGITLFESQLGLVDTTTGLWKVGGGAFYYGNPGDYPFVGDWNGDGVDTPGLYRQSDGYVYLRNSNTQGIADIKFFFGDPGDVPIAGDFNEDGFDTVSIYRPSNQTFYIINELGSNDAGLGAADFSFMFGDPGDEPFAGDLNGDGIDEVGLHRDTTGLVYYRNTLTTGIADVSFIWGDPADIVFAGDWNGDNTDTVGLLRHSDSTFYWRNTNTQGIADGSALVAGGSTDAPVAGTFTK
jgi:5'-nucleotidase/UDP-sugar diphosphatase